MSLYQHGIVVQKAKIDGSENSEMFSRYEESLARDLRTLGVLKFPLHSSTNEDPVGINTANSASKKI